MASSSYFFNVISHIKDIDQFSEGEIDKDYIPYIVNRMVAQYRDLVHIADAMNVSYDIPKEQQLFIYNQIIPKKKRKALWTNKKKDKNLEIIMEYYGISQDKAMEYYNILTKEQIEILSDYINSGGPK
jgi:hypothetical protein